MPKLKHSKVYRGGITANYTSLETTESSFNPNIKDRALDLRFNLASKGGGTTSVLFQLGVDDLPAILDALAANLPEMSVGMLSDAAAKANKAIVERLAQARIVGEDQRARAEALVESLEGVEEFVSDKYYEAPSGEDEKEAQAKQALESALSTLRQLTSST